MLNIVTAALINIVHQEKNILISKIKYYTPTNKNFE